MLASTAVGIFGAAIGLAALAIIVARPDIVTKFFGGASQLIATATSPAGGRLAG